MIKKYYYTFICLLLAAFSFFGCADFTTAPHSGKVSLSVPFCPETSARASDNEANIFYFVFDFTFSDDSTKTLSAKSGELISLEEVPLGNISISAKAYLIKDDKPENFPDQPLYTGTTNSTVQSGENSITIKLQKTKSSDQNGQGTAEPDVPEVMTVELSDISEERDYNGIVIGIDTNSIPEDFYIRYIYVDSVCVGYFNSVEHENGNPELSFTRQDEWGFYFTEPETEYTVSVEYLNYNYQIIARGEISLTAEKGMGSYSFSNPVYKLNDNYIEYTEYPAFYYDKTELTSETAKELFGNFFLHRNFYKLNGQYGQWIKASESYSLESPENINLQAFFCGHNDFTSDDDLVIQHRWCFRDIYHNYGHYEFYGMSSEDIITFHYQPQNHLYQQWDPTTYYENPGHYSNCYYCRNQIFEEHSYSETASITTVPSYFTTGTKVIQCSKCSFTKEEDIPKLTPVSLEDLGSPTILNSSELASYGISSSSTPSIIENATYVTFGVFPQTIKASSVEVADGKATVNGGTQIINSEISGATYYLGNDGAWYAKAEENGYDDTYTYSDETIVSKKNTEAPVYKYFKVEPVVWRVLTTKTDEDVTKYMLLSEKILISDVAFYPHLSVNRTINNQTVYSNNYKHSSIRAFLNGLSFEEKPSDSDPQSSNSDYLSKGFLQQAFTSTHQTKISETTVDNSAASTIDSYEYLEQATLYACDNTIDKIFLLSELEITTSEYKFNTDSSRIRFPTDFAWANYCDGFWLLRSPESKVSYTNGIVNYAGDYKTFQPVDRTYGGIVPALWLELPQ